jgi:hypothetical protein
MFSLKSFVLLALLASVSANRDLLQGGFFILDFFSFFLGDASRTFFFFLAGGDIGGPSTPFFCFWMPGLSPDTESH